jgi:hypothetical protein
MYYGRVDRETAGTVLDAHLARRIALDNYRGRSIHTFAVQAAERFVRERRNLLGIDDVALESVARAGGTWRVSFRAGDEQVTVLVDEETGDLTRMTCSSEGLERPPRYVVSPA